MKVLVLNTYAGSLLLGARAAGCEIIGSYEDVGYGAPIQHANFPGLDFKNETKDWPAQDLSDVIVIAHPPCSAFSGQNTSPSKRGIDSPAFACTKVVLEYAMKNRAVALAIESVPGALTGAWEVHEHYAREYGYHIYRIMQNGAMFSAQNRNRFWAIFVREGAGINGRNLHLGITPKWQIVKDVIANYEDSQAPESLDKLLRNLKARLPKTLSFTEGDLSKLFDIQSPPHIGKIDSVVRKLWNIDADEAKKGIGETLAMWSSHYMAFLDPDKTCGVLLGCSWWYINGRNLSNVGYKRLMGFPTDYIFPGPALRNIRTYLSKGVIPAVATWVLNQLMVNLGERDADNDTLKIEAVPDGVADFRYRKSSWGEDTPELYPSNVTGRPTPAPAGKPTIIVPSTPETCATCGQKLPEKSPAQVRREELEAEYNRVVAELARLEGSPQTIPELEAPGESGELQRESGELHQELQREPREQRPESLELRERAEPLEPRAEPRAVKRRVILGFSITLTSPASEEIVRESFQGKKDVVLPPLKELAANDGALASNDGLNWVGQAQYEPPNKGGARTDVERIIGRAVRKLDKAGYGPISVMVTQ